MNSEKGKFVYTNVSRGVQYATFFLDFARPYLIRCVFMHRRRSEKKKSKKIIFHQQPAKKLTECAKFANNQKKNHTLSPIYLRNKSKPSLERKYSVLSNDIVYLIPKYHYEALMGRKWSKTPKNFFFQISLQGATGGRVGCLLSQHAYSLIQHDIGCATWYKF